MSSQRRFTLNVNFTSTPKIKKFRSIIDPIESQSTCHDCPDCRNFVQARQQTGKQGRFVMDESEETDPAKRSLVLMSLNDYLRGILQKRQRNKRTGKCSSVHDLSKRIFAGQTGVDCAVSRKLSLRQQKRRSMRRRDGCRNRKNQQNESAKTKPTKSSPIQSNRFCDLKFTDNNIVNNSAFFSNGFNQLGQLKVWYV